MDWETLPQTKPWPANNEKVDLNCAFPRPHTVIPISDYFCSAALCPPSPHPTHTHTGLCVFVITLCSPIYLLPSSSSSSYSSTLTPLFFICLLGQPAWITLVFPTTLVSSLNSSSIPIVFAHSLFFCHSWGTCVFILEGIIYKAKLVWVGLMIQLWEKRNIYYSFFTDTDTEIWKSYGQGHWQRL